MEFEWDEAKRLTNIAKHGIDFQEAAEVFDGRPIVVDPSPYVGEERFMTTGLFNDVFITIIWTRRSRKIRNISARRARDGERRAYRDVHDG